MEIIVQICGDLLLFLLFFELFSGAIKIILKVLRFILWTPKGKIGQIATKNISDAHHFVFKTRTKGKIGQIAMKNAFAQDDASRHVTWFCIQNTYGVHKINATPKPLLEGKRVIFAYFLKTRFLDGKHNMNESVALCTCPTLVLHDRAMFTQARDYAKILEKKVKPKSKLSSGKSKKKVNSKIEPTKSKNIYKFNGKFTFSCLAAYIILIITSDVSPGISFFRILRGGAGDFYFFLLFYFFRSK